MKNNLIKPLLIATPLMILANTPAHCETVDIAFKPLTPGKLSMPANTVSVLKYKITNASATEKVLKLTPLTGITQTFEKNSCKQIMLLAPKQSCNLILTINGEKLLADINNGPVLCEPGKNTCYEPSDQSMRLRINITPPLQNAKLSIDGTLTLTNGVGKLTIHNDSTDITATNIQSQLPQNIRNEKLLAETKNTCTSVAPGKSCTLEFAADKEQKISNAILDIAGDNTTHLKTKLSALEIGNKAFGGEIGCLEKPKKLKLIVAVSDLPNEPWTPSPESPEGVIASSFLDGAANTRNILAAYGNGSMFSYAAWACSQFSIDSNGRKPCRAGAQVCYNDWFLPAVEQLSCIMQNNSKLEDAHLHGDYWSSTDGTSQEGANIAYVVSTPPYGRDAGWDEQTKTIPAKVRCVRLMSPAQD
ncbi:MULTISPECIES: hypothetical protein [Legionella]|uniref:DUF1566 domain-containing protein n=1 Tax=Legionella septentrionalis TaxID=2498109 RepID=A0A3S0VPD5_9GAMM|nr:MULTISPECIES: hypothetical protein [Legionella]MCP0913048.1 DUF1566 domain-containing protein [Legionella sp. 27cVA30]RUQ91503.1 hypothetical protein EKM59_00105 [Legionella septentrionalis]RUQ98493.1 hypothetical protein ELY11_05575 [Legionella septentrionalis]RUR10877.1 hypothetical protein ELY14_03475 [Legionella septentrionalis]RUR14589.1 hypothetical protein ELY10_08185 [Legionella septentrionalis]